MENTDVDRICRHIEIYQNSQDTSSILAKQERLKTIQERINKLMSIKGKETVDTIHRKLGHIMWEYIGMARDAKGLNEAISKLKELKKEF